MSTISSLGLSGLPLDDLLTNLKKNESQVLSVIQSREQRAQSKLSAYGKLKDALTTFQDAAQKIAGSDAFDALSVKTGSAAFSATTGKGAIPGRYAIRVDQLAQAHSMAAPGRAARDSAIGGTGGAITITLANGESHTVDLGNQEASLDNLVKTLNADPDIGVNATLINNGGDTPYQLLLTSRDTGTETAIARIDVAGNDTLDAFLGFDADTNTNGYAVQAAQDAEIQINGIAVTSASNTLADVIEGVTLTLNTTSDTADSLDLTADNDTTKKAVKTFITAYNDLLGTVKKLSAFDVDNETAQPLAGDALARSVQSRMRAALSGTGGGDHLTLSALGITTDPKTGELSVDETKLDTAVAEHKTELRALFTGPAGLGTQAEQAAETFTRADGLFSNATDGLDKSIADIQKQYQAASDRIDQRMETYRRQFVQLDAMMSQMNSLSSYLTQQLGMLGNLNSSNQ